jgi:hypothetical protein
VVVVVDAKAGTWEKRAATDLVKYIELMSGVKPTPLPIAPAPVAPANSRTPQRRNSNPAIA